MTTGVFLVGVPGNGVGVFGVVEITGGATSTAGFAPTLIVIYLDTFVPSTPTAESTYEVVLLSGPTVSVFRKLVVVLSLQIMFEHRPERYHEIVAVPLYGMFVEDAVSAATLHAVEESAPVGDEVTEGVVVTCPVVGVVEVPTPPPDVLINGGVMTSPLSVCVEGLYGAPGVGASPAFGSPGIVAVAPSEVPGILDCTPKIEL
jgi:hypothetical protein